MISQFLDWVQQQQNVWIAWTWQLLQWVMNLVPLSQLDSLKPLKCNGTPSMTSRSAAACPSTEDGLVEPCAFFTLTSGRATPAPAGSPMVKASPSQGFADDPTAQRRSVT